MNDIEKAIERLKWIELYYENANIMKQPLQMIIQALEKQLNDGWMPVSERLPERIFEDCLITTEKGEIYTSEFYGYGEECQGFKEYPEGVWQIDQYGEKVIAWQSLPEPYKEVE